jgi:ribosomal protein L37AE/L43A
MQSRGGRFGVLVSRYSETNITRILWMCDNCFKLVSGLAYSSTVQMEATRTCESAADFQRTTQRCIPE